MVPDVLDAVGIGSSDPMEVPKVLDGSGIRLDNQGSRAKGVVDEVGIGS